MPTLGLRAFLAFITSIVNFFIFFFKTILNPSAADDYAKRSRRGGGPGGGPPRPPRGPRITGLSDLRDAGGGELSCCVGCTAFLASRPSWLCGMTETLFSSAPAARH